MKSLGSILKFVLIYLLLGLMQLWFTLVNLLATPATGAIEFKTLCRDGVLLFFGTAVFAAGLDLLLAKNLNANQIWIVSVLVIGFGTLTITGTLFLRIINCGGKTEELGKISDFVYSASLLVVAVNLIFLFVVQAAGSAPKSAPAKQRDGDL